MFEKVAPLVITRERMPDGGEDVLQRVHDVLAANNLLPFLLDPFRPGSSAPASLEKVTEDPLLCANAVLGFREAVRRGLIVVPENEGYKVTGSATPCGVSVDMTIEGFSARADAAPEKILKLLDRHPEIATALGNANIKAPGMTLAKLERIVCLNVEQVEAMRDETIPDLNWLAHPGMTPEKIEFLGQVKAGRIKNWPGSEWAGMTPDEVRAMVPKKRQRPVRAQKEPERTLT